MTKNVKCRPRLEFFSRTRLHRDSSGKLRTHTSAMAVDQWSAYLEIFEEIIIHARIDYSFIEDEGFLLDHPRIRFQAIPYYDGPLDFVRRLPEIRSYLKRNIVDNEVFYATWSPSQLSPIVAQLVKNLNAPLLVVLIGDIEEVSKSIIPFPLNNLAARLLKKREKKAVSSADAVVYVTLRTLQEKYPAQSGALTLARSDVHLPPEPAKKPLPEYKSVLSKGYFSLIAVGSQQQNYKGHDILLASVAELQREGQDVRLTLVGQGTLHDDLIEKAHELGLKNTTFFKSLGGTEAVSSEIKKHDIFVMPSRTEGMPKVLLEALDAGVFSIGSDVGGIAEILDKECLFSPNSVKSLANKIEYFINNNDRLEENYRLQQKFIHEFKLKHTGNLILKNFLNDWVENFVNK